MSRKRPSFPATLARGTLAAGFAGAGVRGLAGEGFSASTDRGFDTLGTGGLASFGGNGRPPTLFASVGRDDAGGLGVLWGEFGFDMRTLPAGC